MDLLRSLPIGLYLEQPITWLHRIDARVKLLWLVAFLITPIAANPYWRVAIVVSLLLLTLSTWLPFRVWRQQMGLVTVFSLLLFGITMFAPDGIATLSQPRLPMDDLALALNQIQIAPSTALKTSVPALPQPTNYGEYFLLDRGIVRVTRRSLELAIRAATLMFTLIYSANLYLLTTAPEEIAAALESLMRPLRRFNLPVTEIILTLTLSLRFIPLVLEEVQNLVRSVRTRAINWKKLGFRSSTQVWVMIAERLIDNLLVRAEQIASAMQVRGFTSPSQHQVKWHQFKLKLTDWLAIVGIGIFLVARVMVGR
ncbi:MAG: CbiQ family ECF transporter T component [Drouetiella hepatica Uher 2000/2452]|jgi:energy-coupling factor transport system permease protein|uniref:CbiQ family ECF transporter T component n=1 Tax=Drouetiella hepatica Uher 2000/2452 TaxID=904376 RepID=A0A951QD32_9CYAN|nr:CbiQ family ECF transporter T component [Drouetiella hepatica Uher 2000/2452]